VPRDPRHLLFVGISDTVVALDTRDGSEVWRTELGGMSFVVVHWDGQELFASAKGEAFRLDPKTGAIIWQNKLKGLGTGLVTLATTRQGSQSSTEAVLAERKRQEASHAGAHGA
jgi:hypothetical protein